MPDEQHGYPAYFCRWGTRYVAWFCEPSANERFLENGQELAYDSVFSYLASIGTVAEPGVTYTDLGHEHCTADGCPTVSTGPRAGKLTT